MAIIIDGRSEEIPGITSQSFWNDPRLKLSTEDCRPRWEKISCIVLHSTKGIPARRGGPGWKNAPQRILSGLGKPANAGNRAASCWADDGRKAGAHLVVDFDGSVTCHADLKTIAAYHAGAANGCSLGLEIYQGAAAEMYAGQLDVVVALVDWLTKRFGIQRAIPAAYMGSVPRLEGGPSNFVGVFGHRDCSASRGPGDPGDEIFRLFAAAGYERWDIEAEQDLVVWSSRQVHLGVLADGIPGPKTVAALLASGRPGGIWVRRPGDEPVLA